MSVAKGLGNGRVMCRRPFGRFGLFYLLFLVHYKVGSGRVERTVKVWFFNEIETAVQPATKSGVERKSKSTYRCAINRQSRKYPINQTTLCQ